jgi:ABC-type branched-subunit amino acid transport system substrate-binding protein
MVRAGGSINVVIRRVAPLLALLMFASACSVHRLDDSDVSAAGEVVAPFDGVTAPGGSSSTTLVTVPGTPPVTLPDGSPAPTTPSGGPATTVASNEARTASDRGITPDVMKLGILAISEDTFAAVGATDTKRHEDVMRPFIEEINQNGGINGRQLDVKVTRYDPLNPDTMQGACVEQAEDHKVFASIAQGAFFGDAEVCMATKQVPLLTGNPSSEHTLYAREQGWVRSTAQNKTRNAKIWIDWMLQSGLLTPDKKVGILYTDVPEDSQLVEDVVVPYFQSKGLPKPIISAYSASIAQTPTESQSIVLKYRGEGVQLVLPFVSFLRMLLFTQQAEGSGYRPQYSASDFGEIASDATAGFPVAQWEGVTGITTHRTGIDPPGEEPTTPQYRECTDTYKRYGGTLNAKDDPVEFLNMIHYCQHFALFADAARRAGTNPTRQSYLQAIGNTGTWNKRVIFSEAMTFAPNKYDGPDLYQVVKWQSGCTADGGCYRQIRGFERGAW